jgi:hypothetical protein
MTNDEKDLPVLEPTPLEKSQIKELEFLYPQLDYLMCLTLVKSSKEQLDEIMKTLPSKVSFEPNTSTLIKDGITIE